MERFYIKLANIPIETRALYSSTKEFCADYFTEEHPAFSVTISQGDIDEMREISAEQNREEGLEVIDYPDTYLETLALYRKITEQLLQYGVLLFHGAVTAVKGEAYLFTAKSGTGKTTHTKLWCEHIPNCHILNGDKPLLLFKEGKVYACGTPWQGKEDEGTNEILPLKALCVLERSRENTIVPLSFGEALPVLLTQSHHPEGSENVLRSMELIKQFGNVPLYRLGCNMEPEAALVAFAGMQKG